ncbi:MAG: DNA restriction-modification system endonuclease subunit [Candidatus Desulfovibrio kirbyi]|jgi:hypothetical protein|uniref:DNA restriction-modification system endonuclease subunit n=1 Tax=Candidatus Desulfovibrio kirbyi TaxID=2696086 RepID=A0A6L2R7E9_9BACT|nr:MAG: DNA restriction-modification system endonuclease subunit [Candidatus Desulfovibrio kirbyi]
MKIYTKESLIDALKDIRAKGWIKSRRPGNDGAVGNTLEDLFGIEENNLPIPNAAEWELKAQREKTNSLVTLFHMEPSPRALKFIPKILLPIYGWKHEKAGTTYQKNERSFRQTIKATTISDRGFYVNVERQNERVSIAFDIDKVDQRHDAWRKSVIMNGGKILSDRPYWGFHNLYHKAGTKLFNCFFIKAESKIEDKIEYFKFSTIIMLRNLSKENILNNIESGNLFIDFDARTGHNHGTKFRIHQKYIPELYAESRHY